MTRLDFAKGWLFLTAQPWGKAYRTQTQTTVGGEPSPADLQSEFYYQAFERADPAVWLKACQQNAMGDSWPSVATLKQSLRDMAPPPPSITSSVDWGPQYITKEEFGVTLFETIKTISGMVCLLQQNSTEANKASYTVAREYLANQLASLTESEMQQILERYPDVARL